MRRKEREISGISEIESVISSCDVCRVAFANGNIPYIVTMNFGYAEGEKSCFYFHCAPGGRKLEMLKQNNYVCFELDTDHRIYKGDKGCDWGMNFTSVVGYGKIFIVNDKSERIAGMKHIMDQYGGSGVYAFDESVMARTTILRLDIEEITGKRK